MTRLLVPELEARRHLIEGYAQFPDVPEDVTNLWKAPFGPPEEWDLCVAEQTIDGPVGCQNWATVTELGECRGPRCRE